MPTGEANVGPIDVLGVLTANSLSVAGNAVVTGTLNTGPAVFTSPTSGVQQMAFETGGGGGMNCYAGNIPTGYQNGLVISGDICFIYTNGTQNTGAFFLGPWTGGNAGGLRMDYWGNATFTPSVTITAQGAYPSLAVGGAITANEITLAVLSTPVNAAFTTATTGGSLASNTTYYYRVAAIDNVGTTLASTETSILTATGTATNTVTVNWGAVAGVNGYKVYGRTTGAELLLATISPWYTLTWTDTGSGTPSGALPTLNTTGAVVANLVTASTIKVGSVPVLTVEVVQSKTATYTMLITDNTLLMNSASATAVTLTTSGLASGWVYTVKNLNSGVVTITGASGTIDGSASITLPLPYQLIWL